MITIADSDVTVTGGVDTHLDTHMAAALDVVGGQLGIREFAATPDGYVALLAWLASFGTVVLVGVEGSGSYGAGLTRYLQAAGVSVVEVDRPNRQNRRRRGKSDPIDAVSAARAALSGDAATQAKTRTGPVEAIRVLRVARTSARHDRTEALNQMRSLVSTAPDALRESLRDLTGHQLIVTAAALRPGAEMTVLSATKTALRELARRAQYLAAQIKRLDALLRPLVTTTAPEMMARHGVGPDSAGKLLVAAGDNPGRLRHEGAFAHLCGAAPIEASSGKVIRHRLNQGGDRHANNALWTIAMTRMVSHPETRAYVARRTAEGKSKREIIRCLKRYIARELFPLLPQEAGLTSLGASLSVDAWEACTGDGHCRHASDGRPCRAGRPCDARAAAHGRARPGHPLPGACRGVAGTRTEWLLRRRPRRQHWGHGHRFRAAVGG